MFLLEWYHRWLEIRAEFNHKKIELSREAQTIAEPKICESCETLKSQLEIANYEKKQLLDRLLEKPTVIPERTVAPIPTSRPHVMNWRVKQQMLEREDREKARAMREASQPDSAEKTEKVDVSDLEKKLGVAEQEREAKASN